MTLKGELQEALDSIITNAGTPIRIQYFTSSIGSVYDDDVTLSKSGNDLWTSGVVLPLNIKAGTFDSLLVEQGKLRTDDVKLFVHGSIFSTGSQFEFNVMIGSPGDVYSAMSPGTIAPQIQGERIYRKMFLRLLTNGSLMGQ